MKGGALIFVSASRHVSRSVWLHKMINLNILCWIYWRPGVYVAQTTIIAKGGNG